jgi:competence protein ComEC
MAASRKRFHQRKRQFGGFGLTLGNVSFVLTGDAEADGVWTQIANQIPPNTKFFKVPHHGSDNGLFTVSGSTPWLNALPQGTIVAISCHIRPFNHPRQSVVAKLPAAQTYRTDQHYHVTIETDGSDVKVSYSHV